MNQFNSKRNLSASLLATRNGAAWLRSTQNPTIYLPPAMLQGHLRSSPTSELALATSSSTISTHTFCSFQPTPTSTPFSTPLGQHFPSMLQPLPFHLNLPASQWEFGVHQTPTIENDEDTNCMNPQPFQFLQNPNYQTGANEDCSQETTTRNDNAFLSFLLNSNSECEYKITTLTAENQKLTGMVEMIREQNHLIARNNHTLFEQNEAHVSNLITKYYSMKKLTEEKAALAKAMKSYVKDKKCDEKKIQKLNKYIEKIEKRTTGEKSQSQNKALILQRQNILYIEQVNALNVPVAGRSKLNSSQNILSDKTKRSAHKPVSVNGRKRKSCTSSKQSSESASEPDVKVFKDGGDVQGIYPFVVLSGVGTHRDK